MSKEHRTALIAGGTSGLGLELATLLHTKKNFEVYATGRKELNEKQIKFISLDIDAHADQLPNKIEHIFSCLPGKIDLFVYSAGFCREAPLRLLGDDDVAKMLNVSLTVPILILNRILNRQDSLTGFIAITSTSQWTPRIYEPIYTAAKAGLGMFANSLALDPQVEKVLVAGPAGMKTNFWSGMERDTNTMLEPSWVAEQICQLYFEDNFRYECIRILREPPRVEFLERRA